MKKEQVAAASDPKHTALAEVERLHEFFVDWFCGTCPKEGEAWSRFGESLDASFDMVNPGGVTLGREALLAALHPLHGHRPEESGFRIGILNATARDLGEGLFLVSYEEWQEAPGAGEPARGRQSTALLRMEDQGPRWLHVHETWFS